MTTSIDTSTTTTVEVEVDTTTQTTTDETTETTQENGTSSNTPAEQQPTIQPEPDQPIENEEIQVQSEPQEPQQPEPDQPQTQQEIIEAKTEDTIKEQTPDSKEAESNPPQPSKKQKTMRSLYATQYGNPQKVLAVGQLPLPIPSSSQVIIQVYAAALNPVDYKIVEGRLSKILWKTFPYVVGRDFSGVIVALGTDIIPKNYAIGDRVCGTIGLLSNIGTMSEYLVIDRKYIAKIPPNCNFMQAAALPLAAMTAYQCLVKRKGRLKTNDKVLILGGSSGCGAYAIQIAKAYGAGFIACTSSKAEFCQSMGADLVINYKEEKWEETLAGENYDIIVDCVGGKQEYTNSKKVLIANGHFVTIVGDIAGGTRTTISNIIGRGLSIGNRKFWSMFGYQNYDNFTMDPNAVKGGLLDLMKLVADGKLVAVIDEDSPYTFETYLDMFEKQMLGKAHGKLVMKVRDYEEADIIYPSVNDTNVNNNSGIVEEVDDDEKVDDVVVEEEVVAEVENVVVESVAEEIVENVEVVESVEVEVDDVQNVNIVESVEVAVDDAQNVSIVESVEVEDAENVSYVESAVVEEAENVEVVESVEVSDAVDAQSNNVEVEEVEVNSVQQEEDEQ